ncbi:MAG: hypothetical protein WD972_03715 [Candidatus Andersenbacteria bacterium]
MFKFFGKSKSDTPDPAAGAMTWDAQATQGLEQALAQAPVPAMLKGRIRQELVSAAEGVAQRAGRTTVTAQDLMEGLLSKLPASMKSKVEDAVKGGPEKLKELENDLQQGK